MSVWPVMPLGRLIKEVSERNRDVGCTDVYSVTNSQGFVPSEDYFNKKVFSKDITNYKLVRRGMFAYNPSRINVGSISWLQNKECVAVSPLYVIFRIKGDTITQRWVEYFLRSDMGLTQIRSLTSGSVRDSLKYSALERIEIPIAPIDKQRYMVENLEAVDEAIALCQGLLTKTEETVKSRFIEMFGDPVTNPMGWEVKTIGDVATDVKYGTSAKASDNGRYKYLRMNNLTYDGYLDLTDLKYIDVSNDELEKYVVRKGDVLFNRTNSTELVGKTALFDFEEDMIIAGYIIRVRLEDNVSPVFFTRFMNMEHMKSQLRAMAKGAVNQANINAQEMKSIEIYLPPIALQNQFADFVALADKSELAIRELLEKHELMKAALMQQYFS